MDILSLQKILKDKAKEKEKIETEITQLYGKAEEERRKIEHQWGGPKTALEGALQLLRIESDSLVEQIRTHKRELEGLVKLHSNVHESHGVAVAQKTNELKVLEVQIATKKEALEGLLNRFAAKEAEVVILTNTIQTLQFEVDNYNKTVTLVSSQLKELIRDIRGREIIRNKLVANIRDLKRTQHITAEHVLTERNKRLFKQHKQMTGMNKALAEQIERKRKVLK